MELAVLFFSALGAATLLPLQSEAVLVGFLYQQKYAVALLILTASLGNILGSCVNWYLGTHLERYQHKKWFPISTSKMQSAQQMYQRYGFWMLLGSWIPVIGDPITLISGVLRENLYRFLLLVTIAKTGRYLFVYAMFEGMMSI